MIKKLLLAIFFLPSLAFAAFDYDGTDDHHSVDNINKGGSSQTACGWINSDGWPGDGVALFAYGNGADSSGGRGFSLVVTNTGMLKAIIWDGGDGYNCYNDPSPTLLSSSTDYHICIVVTSGTNCKLYINGSEEADNGVANTSANSTDDFLVGEPIPNADYGIAYFGGKITQVALWNAALSEANIDSMADKSTCPTDVESGSLQVFLKHAASPATDSSANAFTVSTGSAPSLVADPSGLPCGAASTYAIIPILKSLGDY